MKIAIIGFGKVSREIIRHACLFRLQFQLTVITNYTHNVQGFILDLKNTYFEDNRNFKFLSNIQIGSDLGLIKDANLIFICRGNFLSKADKIKLKKHDTSGRFYQSYANYNMIIEIGQFLSENNIKAPIIVITNQSDILSEILRDVSPFSIILGYGLFADNSRFKMLVKEEKSISSSLNSYLCGLHSHELLYLENYFLIDNKHYSNFISKQDANKILEITKTLGKKISDFQKNEKYEINSGSSILHGKCLALLIQSYCTPGYQLIESFNIRLESHSISNLNLTRNIAISFPVKITLNKIEPLSNLTITNSEFKKINQIVARLENDVINLHNHFT